MKLSMARDVTKRCGDVCLWPENRMANRCVELAPPHDMSSRLTEVDLSFASGSHCVYMLIAVPKFVL